MRRYLVNNPLYELHDEHFDVVIAGAGLSGLYAALLLDDRLRVAVLVKTSLQQCNSALAQGGIAAAIHQDDSPEIHLRDTVKAAASEVDMDSAKLLVEAGPAEIERLALLGVAFDTDQQGNLLTTCEGAHRRQRILHCGGDATGKLIMQTLANRAVNIKNITFFEDHFLTDILTDQNQQVAGVVAFHKQFRVFYAPHVIIATGGAGGVYQYTTNYPHTTGDGIAAATRAGAMLQHMEFVQFHPTAFHNPQNCESLFLISEAVRGEGAVLRNGNGEPFMMFRHRFKDLAPRDVVAREIFREMTEGGLDHVWLDITHRNARFLKKRFPTIYEHCQKYGFSMEKNYIPVVPAQHYLMGGIKVNLNGEASLQGLYACGEAACTGVHGANRLASNSLLECIVFASRVVQSIHSKDISQPGKVELQHRDSLQILENLEALKALVRKTMQTHGGIVRSEQGLVHGIDLITAIAEKSEKSVAGKPSHFELANMVTVGREILLSALARRESTGAHFLEEETEDVVFIGW